MSFWTAIVIIVAIMALAEVIKSKHRSHRSFDKQRENHALPAADSDARREIEDLRERIKVLERIATDGNTPDARETQRISREIDALRDRQDG